MTRTFDGGTSSRKNHPTKWLTIGLICMMLCNGLLFPPLPCRAQSSPDQVENQFHDLTRRILVTGIELERFSLNYRLEGAKQPRFKRLRYFLTQEAGAAGLLALEIVTVDQLNEGRRDPLRINPNALRRALRGVLATAIIAGSGSCFELASNGLLAIKNRRRGFDHRSANKFVASKMKLLDDLLSQREALVKAHSEHPLYATAVLEGDIMRELRNSFAYEYSQFHEDLRGYRVNENLFYMLNIATNVVAAVSAHYGIKGVDHPEHNKPADILFTIAGAFTIASPLLATAGGYLSRRLALHGLSKQLGERPHHDIELVRSNTRRLQDLLSNVDPTGTRSAGVVLRSGAYAESGDLFRKQLRRETALMKHLDNVAVQSDLLGPAIGGTLLTQGIMGTVGHYKYEHHPLKELNLVYKGAVVGLPGASTAVVATAAALLGDWHFENRQKKQKRLPAQLIEQRLKHLDDLGKEVDLLAG